MRCLRIQTLPGSNGPTNLTCSVTGATGGVLRQCRPARIVGPVRARPNRPIMESPPSFTSSIPHPSTGSHWLWAPDIGINAALVGSKNLDSIILCKRKCLQKKSNPSSVYFSSTGHLVLLNGTIYDHFYLECTASKDLVDPPYWAPLHMWHPLPRCQLIGTYKQKIWKEKSVEC